jgi:hypothetical protein
MTSSGTILIEKGASLNDDFCWLDYKAGCLKRDEKKASLGIVMAPGAKI